mmetsp:Transcript_20255/g.36555  ORF Transcript_20255/g.36555 Transcript_20255/m.36555 type:complete len:259 (-) Transcript_20255:310-1086(-)
MPMRIAVALASWLSMAVVVENCMAFQLSHRYDPSRRLRRASTSPSRQPCRMSSMSTVAPSEIFYNDTDPAGSGLAGPIDHSYSSASSGAAALFSNDVFSPPVTDTNSVVDSTQVAEIASMQELLDTMNGQGHDDDGLTLVKYYANYCKICQRASIQLKKVAKEYPNVQFAKVEQGVMTQPSAETLRTLGVRKFPFVQIYRGGKCVASFSTGPSHIFVKKVRDTLDMCLDRTPEDWDAFVNQFYAEIEENTQARRSLER